MRKGLRRANWFNNIFMNSNQLFNQIKTKKTFLCVGLDTEFEKIPESIRSSNQPQLEFNREIVRATHEQVIAYKINTAFYEARGADGWKEMEQTAAFIRSVDPDVMIIADAKRGDIGNTSEMYARAFLDRMDVDAVTVSPYMGYDTVSAFLKRNDKWVILLAVTSNKSAEDFQFLKISGSEETLYEKVLLTSRQWGTIDNLIYVAGATRPELLVQIRNHIPDHFLLVPGIGAQGGSLEEVARYGINSRCGLIINTSRAVIFADDSQNFAQTSHLKAVELQQQMESILKKYKLI
jgi:orotidine-5'-phosphate decarboxylase